MKKNKGTKRALLGSVIVLLLCLAMLIGSTFAWFTDSAATAQNTIQAGNLDLVVQYKKVDADGNLTNWADVTTQTKLFDDSALWEPGHTEVAYLKVRNAGTLALKYKLAVNAANITTGKDEDNSNIKLADYLMFSHVEQDTEAGMPIYDRAAAQAAAGSGQSLGKYSEVVSLAPNAEKYIALAVTMPTYVGNEANYRGNKIPSIALGISLVATQDTVESDSFGTDYDANAVYPAVSSPVNVKITGTIVTGGKKLSVDVPVNGRTRTFYLDVPAGSVNGDTEAVFSMVLTESTPNSSTYEISLKDADGNPITLNKEATVRLYLPEDLEGVQVSRADVPMEKEKYTYSPSTGQLKIYTNSFGTFKITYKLNTAASANGVSYPTLNEALKAAQDGGEVVLQQDAVAQGTMAGTALTISAEKNVTIDLNNCKLTPDSKANVVMTVDVGADVTIKNGTIESGVNGIKMNEGAKLTLENVDLKVSGSNAIWTDTNQNNVTIEMKNSNITSSGNGVTSLGSNNRVTVEGSTINVETCGIIQNGTYGGNTFTVNNSTITSKNVGIYISNMTANAKQTLTMNGCTVSGVTAVEIKHTDATITDSTLTATSAEKTSKAEGSGSCTTGYALAVTSNGSTEAATGNVTVTGGGMTADNVFVFQNTASVTINGVAAPTVNAYGTEG